jgi:hypothetical protein
MAGILHDATHSHADHGLIVGDQNPFPRRRACSIGYHTGASYSVLRAARG